MNKDNYNTNKIELLPAHYDEEEKRLYFFCLESTKEQEEWLLKGMKIKRNSFDFIEPTYAANQSNEKETDAENSKVSNKEYEEHDFFDFYIKQGDIEKIEKNIQDPNGKSFSTRRLKIALLDFIDDWVKRGQESDFLFTFILDRENNWFKVKKHSNIDEKYVINLKEAKNDKQRINYFSVVEPNFINVGQGLSFFDISSNLIYDAGGSIQKQDYISEIKAKIRGIRGMKLFISHLHFDHYRYAFHLLKEGIVSEVLFGEKLVGGKNAKKLHAIYKNKIKIIKDGHTEGAYTFRLPESVMSKKLSINERSVIAYSDKVLLTGDSTYEIIDKTLRYHGISRRWEIIQIPHHGAKNDLRYLMSNVDILDSDYLVLSFREKNNYNHPDNSLVRLLETTNSIICDVTEKNTVCKVFFNN